MMQPMTKLDALKMIAVGVAGLIVIYEAAEVLGAGSAPVGTPRILFAQTEGGVAKNNTIWSSTTSGPSLIDTAAGVITPPTDTGNYAVNNADIPAAYASPVFGPDYTVAQLRAAFTSKVGGPLDTTPAKGIGVGTTYVDFVNRTTNFPA